MKEQGKRPDQRMTAEKLSAWAIAVLIFCILYECGKRILEHG